MKRLAPLVLLLGCAEDPCPIREADPAHEILSAGYVYATTFVVPWDGGLLLLLGDDEGLHAMKLDTDGEPVGDLASLGRVDMEVLAVAAGAEGLLVVGAGSEVRESIALTARVYGPDLALADTITGGFPAGYDLAAGAAWNGAGYTVGVVGADEPTLFGIGATGLVGDLHGVTLPTRPTAGVDVRWNGTGYAALWQDLDDGPVLSFHDADSVRFGPATALTNGWAASAAPPVWTGTRWMAPAGLRTSAYGRAGGSVLMSGFDASGERVAWEELLAPETGVWSVGAAWEPVAGEPGSGVVVWTTAGGIGAAAVDASLALAGCPVTAAMDDGTGDPTPFDGDGATILYTHLEDGRVRVLVRQGVSIRSWTAELTE